MSADWPVSAQEAAARLFAQALPIPISVTQPVRHRKRPQTGNQSNQTNVNQKNIGKDWNSSNKETAEQTNGWNQKDECLTQFSKNNPVSKDWNQPPKEMFGDGQSKCWGQDWNQPSKEVLPNEQSNNCNQKNGYPTRRSRNNPFSKDWNHPSSKEVFAPVQINNWNPTDDHSTNSFKNNPSKEVFPNEQSSNWIQKGGVQTGSSWNGWIPCFENNSVNNELEPILVEAETPTDEVRPSLHYSTSWISAYICMECFFLLLAFTLHINLL